MHGKRFLVPALAGLLVIVLLFSGVSAMQRNAWSQGYMLGRLSTGADAGAVAPLMPYGYSSGHSFGGGFGLVIGIGLLLLLLGAGRAFHGRPWAMHGGPHGMDAEAWQRMAQAHAERHARHGRHGPPWCWDREEAPQAEPGKDPAANQSAEGAQ
jgi:hypothetical protein